MFAVISSNIFLHALVCPAVSILNKVILSDLKLLAPEFLRAESRYMRSMSQL